MDINYFLTIRGKTIDIREIDPKSPYWQDLTTVEQQQSKLARYAESQRKRNALLSKKKYKQRCQRCSVSYYINGLSKKVRNNNIIASKPLCKPCAQKDFVWGQEIHAKNAKQRRQRMYLYSPLWVKGQVKT
jgi:hypothetical protein